MLLSNNDNALEALAEKHISCFSLTLFRKEKPIISYCNRPEWLEYYSNQYSMYDPLRAYILSAKLRIVPWEYFGFDKPARDYCKIRNEIVCVNANVTLFFPENDYLTALTIGTKHGNAHLMNFLHQDLASLLLVKKACLESLVSVSNMLPDTVSKKWLS